MTIKFKIIANASLSVDGNSKSLPDLSLFATRHVFNHMVTASPPRVQQSAYFTKDPCVQIIPFDKCFSVFHKTGSFSKIKDVKVVGVSGTFIRANIRLESQDEEGRYSSEKVEAHYSRIKNMMGILETLPDMGFLKPLLYFRYTGKKGYEKVKLIMHKLDGDLFDAVRDNLIRSATDSNKIAAQLVLILHQLEDVCKVYHRDIKLENVLYRKDLQN